MRGGSKIIRQTLVTIWAECAKELTLLRKYPFNMITIVIIMYLVFLQLFYTSKAFGSESSLLEGMFGSDDYMGFVLIGIIFWNVALRSLSDIGTTINRDIMTGTIEHIFLSPAHSWFLFTGRGLSSMIVTFLFLSFLAFPLIFIFSIEIHWNFLGFLIILILTLLGVQGLAIVLAGSHFLFKNVLTVTQLLNFVFLYLCGIIFPVQLLPDFLKNIGELLPITLGVESARKILLGNMPLMDYLQSGLFMKLVIQSIAYYVVGVILYLFMISIARKKGTLGQY